MTPQQIDAMKLALEALELLTGAWQTFDALDYGDNAITALNEALAEHAMREVQRLGQEIEQEPVAWQWLGSAHFRKKLPKNADVTAWNPLYTHPPQRTEQEPLAWPCLIDSADFSENTITLVMQCEDYKVSAGTHYLSTTPPKE